MNPLEDLLRAGLRRWELTLTDAQIDALVGYSAHLLDANARMNLTAVTDPSDFARRHLLDSLCPPALRSIPEGAAIIDVGTGAGFPGIPLAIARPDLRVTLVDARRKKIEFVGEAIAALRITNAEALWGRAEDLAHDPCHRETYDAALARALAALPVLSEYLLPFVRAGGAMLAWKGAAAEVELEAARSAISVLGGGCASALPYAISDEFCRLRIIVIDKIRETPPQYPRPAGKIAKKPLPLPN
ncbi:MAG: 16S rRNA (guanine(527)-N(7))-methyltransferase RsmG [Clostridiales bacterium]|nr:16S rRNA (guanine(527)-N(7))-methyltransferase RsmG [Clostridiales bacterium]